MAKNTPPGWGVVPKGTPINKQGVNMPSLDGFVGRPLPKPAKKNPQMKPKLKIKLKKKPLMGNYSK